MNSAKPIGINWDVTYACPLRCTHCYSESGRRASRQLPLVDMLRLADKLIEMQPQSVQFSGGEPLIVINILQVAERLVQAGISLAVYTNGWQIKESILRKVTQLFSRIHVSVDGATPEIHDFIRGRNGSFSETMRTLEFFNKMAIEEREKNNRSLNFGIDCVIIQSNFPQLERYLTEIAPKFSEIKFFIFGAMVPSGLGSRRSFCDQEMLTDKQIAKLNDPAFAANLKMLAPPSVEQVWVTDNVFLQMNPKHIKAGMAANNLMHIEPDGRVRSMAIYEGTVGNLLTESPEEIWQKVLARHNDPFVVRELSAIKTSQDWATAARRIDWHFATKEDRIRISKRQEYTYQ